MKKSLLVIGSLLLAGHAAAWDVKDNPDRFISVGVHAGITHLSGDHSNVLDPGPNETVQMESVGSNLNVAGFDVRLPLFKQVTFTFAYDCLTLDKSNVRTGNTFQSNDGLHGSRVDMGMRFYFSK